MGWRTIYIEESNNLSLYLDNLKTSDIKGGVLIPLKDIDSIIIDNYKLIISSQLLCKCSKNNINFVICDINHIPISQLLPFSGNCLSSKTLKRQSLWSEELKGKLWKDIVYHKITNQVSILKINEKLQNVETMINNLQKDISIYDKTNREGLFAKIYFRTLFGDKFKRFEVNDTVNAGLNFGYVVLRTMIAKSIVCKGLNPMLGIFHKGENNNFNLADDFIKIFRPIIDNYVFNNLTSNQALFTRQHRLEIIKLLTGKIEINGRKQTISNAIDIYIDSIINCFEKNDNSAVLFPLVKVYDI